MSDTSHTFKRYLAMKSSRLTPAREAVLDAILETQGHVTADDCFVRLRQRYPPVSRATVYRTLDLLVQAGLVGRVDLGGNRAFYEPLHGRQQHDHLICVGCGTVIDFEDAGLGELREKVCRSFAFEMASHSHMIWGRCQRCSGDPASPQGA